MIILEIIIELFEDEDYDGNPETVKELSGKINGKPIAPIESFEHTMPDEQCKDLYRQKLVELDYEWDSEI